MTIKDGWYKLPGDGPDGFLECITGWRYQFWVLFVDGVAKTYCTFSDGYTVQTQDELLAAHPQLGKFHQCNYGSIETLRNAEKLWGRTAEDMLGFNDRRGASLPQVAGIGLGLLGFLTCLEIAKKSSQKLPQKAEAHRSVR